MADWYQQEIDPTKKHKDAQGFHLSITSQVVGCYTLHLYCVHERLDFHADRELGHSFQEFPHEYVTHTSGQAQRQARKDGWVLHGNGYASCPKCVKRLSLRSARSLSPGGEGT